MASLQSLSNTITTQHFCFIQGLPSYLPVNLKDIPATGFQEGEELKLESLKSKGLISPLGRERRLPLKILGNGDLSGKLNFKARAFSAAAKMQVEAISWS